MDQILVKKMIINPMSTLSRWLGLIAMVLICAIWVPNGAGAATYYVSESTTNTGTGSQNSPWSSVAKAFGSGKIRGGDHIIVGDGHYGTMVIRGQKFNSTVTIAAARGAVAHFERIGVQESRNITFKGLSVWPHIPTNQTLVLIRSSKNSADIKFHNMDIRSAEDAGNYRSWSKQKWRARKVNGVLAQGPRAEIANSTLTGVYFGVDVFGKGSRIVNNRIIGFSGDGARAMGDESRISGNTIRDCVKIDGNHDDGIMSWSLGPDAKPGGGTVKNLIIEANLIEEWSGPRNHPLICELQGIFLGGYQDGLIIQNNILSLSAFHGITAYGVSDGFIANNTLVNSQGPSSSQPWIGLWGHASRGSKRVIVANNIAPMFKVKTRPTQNLTANGNVVLRNAASLLRAPYAGDYRPRNGSKLIDGGNVAYVPATDIAGTRRALGSGVDIGAYEVR